MLQKRTDGYQAERASAPADRSLQYVLWTLWTLAVAGMAFYRWYSDMAANRPLDVVGLVIYSILVGLGGLLIITLIELRTEPDRFWE